MQLTLLWLLFQAGTPGLLTPDESKEVEAVVSSIIAAGFPDTAGSEVRFGTLDITTSFDPEKEPGPFPKVVPMSQKKVPGTTQVVYAYTFYGLHFKLVDGSWLIELSYRFRPREGDRIDSSNGPRLDLGGLTASAAAILPYHAKKEGSNWLARISPGQRERLASAMEVFVPVSFRLKLHAESFAPAIVLLYRAGWPEAAVAALSVADLRARDYWQMRLWTEPDGPFDPTGEYAWARDAEAAWWVAHPEIELEPPSVALRRALFQWCRIRILADDAILPPDAAAAACKAMLDPGDPQKNLSRIEALLAASSLPAAPGDSADLARRLASWEARPRMPRVKLQGAREDGSGRISMSMAFEPVIEPYTPKPEDLDPLVALLDDERPSRFMDFVGSRSVGDNAWRALAALLKRDPRTLAQYPADKAWTRLERRSAALAVQGWWKDHRQEYIRR